MAEYVLAFRQSTKDSTPEIEQAWGAWFGRIGAHIVDQGHRVGQARMVGTPSAGSDELGGYIVVRGDSLDAAVAIAEGCPGLGSGGRVEVGELVPDQQ
ncbi:MAG: hypothetical protein DLM60_02100 [Pseudonocardiales bacterium]|nr:MAG: hypothetical protein DLM60_02100 [Pseudonocardiales bacterium]